MINLKEEWKIYNGSKLSKEQKNFLSNEKEENIVGNEFYLKINDPKIKIESIFFPLDLYTEGSYEHKKIFRKITNKIRKKHFTSSKVEYMFIDSVIMETKTEEETKEDKNKNENK